MATVMGQEEISDSSRGHERSSRTIAGMPGNRKVSVCSSSSWRYWSSIIWRQAGHIQLHSLCSEHLSLASLACPTIEEMLKEKATQRKGKIDKFLKILFQPQLKPGELLKCLSYLSLDIGL